MYVFIYLCTYVHKYVSIFVCTYVRFSYIYVHVHMYVCIYLCICVCLHVCTYVCIYVHMYKLYMHVCIFLCMYMCMCVLMYVCTWVCVYLFMYECIYFYIDLLVILQFKNIIRHISLSFFLNFLLIEKSDLDHHWIRFTFTYTTLCTKKIGCVQFVKLF